MGCNCGKKSSRTSVQRSSSGVGAGNRMIGSKAVQAQKSGKVITSPRTTQKTGRTKV